MRILFQFPRLAGFLVLLLAFGLDQWSKARILAHADTGLYPHDVTSFFALVLVHNHGVSFGILSHMGPQAITLGTSLLAALLLVWLLRAKETSTAIALGLVVGGALGNILDRLRFGAVTDFLDFHLGFTHWPAFNIADSCIFIGVVILLLFGIVNPAPHSEGSKG